MAANMLADGPDGLRICKAKPGEGKTIVMMLMALYLLTHTQCSFIVIANPEPFVTDQIKNTMALHIEGNRVKAFTITNSFETLAAKQDAAIFIDEGDWYAENCLFSYDEKR